MTDASAGEIFAADDLLAMAMHDMRNPIAIVSGHAHLLREHWSVLTEREQAESLDAILRQTGRLDRIVEDLLTLSQLNGGHDDLSARPVDLHQTISAVIADCGLIDSATIALDAPAWVWADQTRVERILTNLLMNSKVHGAPPIEVVGARRDTLYEIRIRDHGTGVPVEAIGTLFDMFTRSVAEPDDKRRGFGLGLAIARALATIHDGGVWYDGDDNGAVFVMQLPQTWPPATN